MKKLLITAMICATAFVSTTMQAQKFPDLNKSPMDVSAYPSSYKVSEKLVKVTYSRPMLKNRPVNSLAKNGEVWRTGANEAAQIDFYVPMKLGKETIPAGSYSLFTIPGEKEWTIIINKAQNVWGAYTYDQKMDVARLNVPATNMSKESLEAFSIVFEDGKNGNVTMHLGWGNTRITAPFIGIKKMEKQKKNAMSLDKN